MKKALLWLPPLLLLVAAMLGLMRWQWQKANRRELALQVASATRALPPLQPLTVPGQWPLYRRLRLQGHWLAGYTVFWDNRGYQGQPGYHVLTPFQPAGDVQWLWVDRGWMLKVFGSKPVTAAPQGTQIEAEVAPWPEAGELYLDGQVIQNPNAGALQHWQGHQTHGVWLQQVGARTAADPLIREWALPGPAEIAKNRSYAGQWLLFAVTSVGLYLYYVYKGWRQAHV